MKALSYQDILLVPQYSELSSREDAKTSVKLFGWDFKLPIIPANMEDVINYDIARFLAFNGYFYIYHRFAKGTGMGYEPDTYTFVSWANKDKWPLISISTGVNDDTLDILKRIVKENLRVDFITIDVAHGHHIKVKERIKWIRNNIPYTNIIAGNVATFDGYKYLAESGADIIKVGIGQGSICTTKLQTGFSVPMFTCLRNIKEGIESQHIFSSNRVKSCYIIADGGIQNIGDIPKALGAGATMVMSGGLFAPCSNSPAKIVDGRKQYRGSTSFAAKKHNKHVEGKVLSLENDITVEERLQEIKEALQSAISYGGGKDLSCFSLVRYLTL